MPAEITKTTQANSLAAIVPQIMNAIGGGDQRVQEALMQQQQVNAQNFEKHKEQMFMRSIFSPSTGEITQDLLMNQASLYGIQPEKAMALFVQFDNHRKAKTQEKMVKDATEIGLDVIKNPGNVRAYLDRSLPGSDQYDSRAIMGGLTQANEYASSLPKPDLVESYDPATETATLIPKTAGAVIGKKPEKVSARDKAFSTLSPAEQKQAILGREPQGPGLSDIGKLVKERDSLSPNDPNREIYDARIGKLNASAKITENRPFIADLMAKGEWFPSQGRITGPTLDLFENAARRASEMGRPLTGEDLSRMEFSAVKNRSTGQTAGGRVTVARKQNIEAAYGLIDDLKETSKALDYSDTQFVGKVDAFIKGQLNDPVFTEYMTQRADALFVLGNALKQNGLTDKSIEIEEQAFRPTLSPSAFIGYYNTQLRALNRAAEEMNKDFKYDIKPRETVAPGKGGKAPAANPKTNDPLGIR